MTRKVLAKRENSGMMPVERSIFFCMKTKAKDNYRYYFDLGFKVYRKLPSVGREGKSFRDWTTFSTSEGFAHYIKIYKLTDENLKDFQEGFEYASKSQK